jgi:hypothetical protein
MLPIPLSYAECRSQVSALKPGDPIIVTWIDSGAFYDHYDKNDAETWELVVKKTIGFYVGYKDDTIFLASDWDCPDTGPKDSPVNLIWFKSIISISGCLKFDIMPMKPPKSGYPCCSEKMTDGIYEELHGAVRSDSEYPEGYGITK